MMREQKFAAIRELADRACEEAYSHVDSEAVNWADLSCHSVEYYSADDGLSGYRVLIEEASPSASKLQRFVEKYLADHGYAGVEVRTEW